MIGTPRDFIGREITTGCEIAYPRRTGSSMWLTTGQVVGIEPAKVGPASDYAVTVRVKSRAGFRKGVVSSARCLVVQRP
jgi:hypothetical protein